MFGFVVRRIRGRLALAVAMLLTSLIITSVLTALQAYGRTVGDEGLRSALQGPGHDRAVVLVSGTDDVTGRASDGGKVAAFARTLFGGFPVAVDGVSHSHSYGLPGASSTGGGDPDLTRLAALDHDQVRLLAGSWPAPVRGPHDAIQVAVPRAEFARLRLTARALPARIRLSDRYGGPPITVTVTGEYRAADLNAPYWQLDPYGGHEVVLGGFANYGPMLADDSVFTSRAVTEEGRSWLLSPDLSTVRPDQATALRGRVDTAVADFQRGSGLTVQTQLGALLDDVQAGAGVARADELIGSLQLAVLAAAALLLVVRLMTARQAPEDGLLAARGATRRQLGLLGAGQSLLLVLPAAVLAPLFTPPLLRLLADTRGTSAKVASEPALTWQSWLVAGACALGCVLLTAIPALGRGAAGLLRRTGRGQAVIGGAARSGVDLALLALAVLSFQELQHYSTDAGQGLGADPVAVAAPTLALCAGTVVVLRLLPYAARLGSRLAARGTGLSAALVGWQLSRRTGRAAGPTLLLVLAVATGVLALGQHSSWTTSQSDQASFATAGGLRVWNSAIPAFGQGGRYGALPGGDRIIAVSRTTVGLPNGGNAQLLALDAAGAAARLPLRADLRGGRSMQSLFGPLAQPAGGGAGLALPGRPARIDLALTSRLKGFSVGSVTFGPTSEADQSGPLLMVQVRDRFGAVHLLPTTNVPLDGDATVSVNLAGAAGAPLGQTAWPLTLVGVQIGIQPLYGVDLTGSLTVHRIGTAQTPTGPVTDLPVPTGHAWSAWYGGPNDPQPTQPLLTVDQGPGALNLSYEHVINGGLSATLTLGAGANGAGPIPALATSAYLDAVGAKVGDIIPFQAGGSTVNVRVTAAVSAVPTAGDAALVVDLATVSRQLAATGGAAPEPTEWWLPANSPQDPLPARAAAQLRTAGGTQSLQLREEVAAQLTDDPLSAGPQVTLLALALVAVILAAIGFAAATAAAASERTREHAILLALGCPPRRLARTAAAEPALLIALGSAVGLAIGVLMVRLVVPLVVLTPSAQRPMPPVSVALPLWPTLGLVAATAAIPVVIAFLSGRRSAAARPRPLEEL